MFLSAAAAKARALIVCPTLFYEFCSVRMDFTRRFPFYVLSVRLLLRGLAQVWS